MRILIVKMSSMGDIIHTLPALTDAIKHNPDISFDWVVEEGFVDIARWHPHVKRIIPIALRRWRKKKWHSFRSGEIGAFLKDLRKEKYDYIIDAQSSMKSAIVTRLARGKRCGFSFKHTRERFASLFYQKKYPIIFNQHAIQRIRLLFAAVLRYKIDNEIPDFGIDTALLPKVPYQLPEKFVMFFHSTTWVTKLWPENYWHTLITHANNAGYTVLLPWGNNEEKQRAERLAKGHEMAIVPERVSISETASVISKATACVCCDTGLGHATAALNIPAIHLYGPTNPVRVKALGKGQTHLHAKFECAPCYKKQCTYTGESTEKPACFTTVPAELVWEKLKSLL